MSRAREFADLASSTDAGGLTGRNLIINGGMTVAQRNSSSAVTITGDGVYNTVDRFKARTFGGSGRFSMQQVTDTPNNSFANSLKLVVTTTDTSGTNGYAIEHVVEEKNITAAGFGDSDAHPVTLSFWVRSSVTGSYSASLRANGQSGTPANVQEYTISAANTWEHKKITYPAYTGGATLGDLLVDFGLGKQTSKTTSTLGTWQTTNFVFGNNQVDWQSNSGATFYLTGVQLEVGEQGTDFEHRSFGDELARCERYFQQYECSAQQLIYFESNVSNHKFTHTNIYRKMRATPTVSLSTNFGHGGGAGGTINSVTANSIGPDRVAYRVGFTGNIGDSYSLRHSDSFDGDVASYSAEL